MEELRSKAYRSANSRLGYAEAVNFCEMPLAWDGFRGQDAGERAGPLLEGCARRIKTWAFYKAEFPCADLVLMPDKPAYKYAIETWL